MLVRADPIRHGGRWVPELIVAAGGECGLARPGRPAGRVAPDEFRVFDPEVLAVTPCGYALDEAIAATEALLDRVDLSEVAAVRNGRMYAADGGVYDNRHGHHVVDSLEALARIVSPNRFEGSNRGRSDDDRVRRIDTPST